MINKISRNLISFGVLTLIILSTSACTKVAEDTDKETNTPQIEEKMGDSNKSSQLETMKEYVEIAIGVEIGTVEKPSGLVRVEVDGVTLDVKLAGASVPMHVYAEAGWNTRAMDEVQIFYIKSESPSFLLEDPNFEKQEGWSGPYYGKLRLLVQNI